MDDASRLCTGCGLCCNGSVFDYALVEKGEEPTILAAGLEIVEDGGKTHFRLPCSHLSDAGCSRYETRFQVCRKFSCKLLKDMRAGSLDLVAAMSIVDEAKRLLTIVEGHLGVAPTRAARRAKRREVFGWRVMPDDAARTAAAQIDLDLITAKLFLDDHFGNNPEGTVKAKPRSV